MSEELKTEPTERQSDRQTEQSSLIAVMGRMQILIGVIVGTIAIAAAIGSWYVLPFRVALLEKDYQSIKLKTDDQKELLIRIEERVKQVSEQVSRLERKP